jgi:hypothetical protein
MVHEQVLVKVNAPVDRGVAPLVEALNRFPGVVSVESCEGDGEREAYVSFHYGDDWKQLADFVGRLSASLGKDESAADRWFTLSVEWYAGGTDPLGYLRVPRPHITAIAEAIAAEAATVLEADQVLVP